MKTKTKLIRYENICKNILRSVRFLKYIASAIKNKTYGASNEKLIYMMDNKIYIEDAKWLQGLWYLIACFQEFKRIEGE